MVYELKGRPFSEGKRMKGIAIVVAVISVCVGMRPRAGRGDPIVS